LAANYTINSGGADVINFAIAVAGVQTISLDSALPTITDDVILDATSQAGGSFTTPLIDLDGSAIVAAGADGFASDANNVTIKGFVIRNFDGSGIEFQDGSNSIVQSNYIGTDVTGTVAQANGVGILVNGGANNVTIGGTAGEGNIIAFNTTDGIQIDGTDGVSILGNSIFGNVDLGIDLVGGTENAAGVTANDTNDSDTGSNDLQNTPTIEYVTSDGAGQVSISGRLQTDLANQVYRIEFFATGTEDASGYGEAEQFLGAANVTTNNN